jgi:urease accessory protein
MMGAGYLAGIGGIGLPYVELGIALSSIVIGAAAAFGRPMPVAGAMALCGIFAIFHGHAHGAEMPVAASGLLYALGFIAATALLHLAGIGAAIGAGALVGRFGRPLAQAAGGLFALGGIGVLAGWL